MPDVTITIEAGAQSESLVITSDVVDRLIPMVEAVYGPLHQDPDPTLMQAFKAGVRSRIKEDLFRYERQQAMPRRSGWQEPDM